LASVETLRGAAGAAAAAIEQEGDYGEQGAAPQRARVGAELERPSVDDPSLEPLAERAGALLYELQDLARETRSYLGGLDADPERLLGVEERLELYARLERKHGGSVASVLAHAERCRAERDRLVNAGAETARLEV